MNKTQIEILKISIKELGNIITNIGDGIYKFKVKKGKIVDISYEKKIISEKNQYT